MFKDDLKEWGFKKSDFEDVTYELDENHIQILVDKANIILAEKVRAHSVPVLLYKGPKYTHEGRVILIKEIQKG